jgi:hypothetical protein
MQEPAFRLVEEKASSVGRRSGEKMGALLTGSHVAPIARARCLASSWPRSQKEATDATGNRMNLVKVRADAPPVELPNELQPQPTTAIVRPCEAKSRAVEIRQASCSSGEHSIRRRPPVHAPGDFCGISRSHPLKLRRKETSC